MNTKPVFHGSDIEKICEYYHLNQEDIVNFGANVNPIGISTHVKQVLASHLDLLSSYPDRDYQSLRNTVSEYCGVPADYVLPGNGSSYLSFNRNTRPKAHPSPWTNLFGILQRVVTFK